MHPTSYIKLGKGRRENLKHPLVVLWLCTLSIVALPAWADTSDTGGLFDSGDTDTGDTDTGDTDNDDTDDTDDTDDDTDTDIDTDTAVLEDTSNSDWVDGSTAAELAGELGGAPSCTSSCASSTSGVGIPLLGFVILIGLSRRRNS
jgi:hypothetical protein